MSRQEFLGKLRAGLYGLPAARINDIVADYESHFEEGRAAGRSEAEVVAALGDPARLAKELRAEAHVERWKEERTPSAGAAAVVALIGLIALDWFFLLPIATVVLILLLAIGGLAIGLFVAGPFLATSGYVGVGPGSLHLTLTQAQALLAGVCMSASGVALGALTLLIGAGCVRAIIAWARLHVQVVNPRQPV